MYAVIGDITETLDARQWPETAATVTKSETVIDNSRSENPYGFDIEYTFQVNNQPYTGNRYHLDKIWKSSINEMQELAQQYPVGTAITVHYNDENPNESFVNKPGLAILFLPLFPLVFILIGVGGLAGVWFSTSARDDANGKSTASISESFSGSGSGKKKWGQVGLVFFFFIFFAAGAGITYPILVKPLMIHSAAKQWVEVDAVVESSQIRSHRGEDSTTYSADILYRYEFDGRTYQSNEYDLFSTSSSNRRSHQKIVDDHPEGKTITVFVDPQNPSQSLVNRELGSGLFLAAVPLVFIMIGLVGMGFAIRSVLTFDKRSESRRSNLLSEGIPTAVADASWLPDAPPAELEKGMYVLRSAKGRLYTLLGSLLFAIFWNGIISIFITMAVQSHLDNDPDWFLTLFMIPFVVIGIGLIFWFFHSVLALFNPRLEVRLDQRQLKPGEPFHMAWSFVGNPSRVSQLSITLECFEKVTYRRGTTTTTEDKSVRTITLDETDNPTHMQRGGDIDITLPLDAMHSFKVDQNEIHWQFILKGEIKRWPDIKAKFPVVVVPNTADERFQYS